MFYVSYARYQMETLPLPRGNIVQAYFYCGLAIVSTILHVALPPEQNFGLRVLQLYTGISLWVFVGMLFLGAWWMAGRMNPRGYIIGYIPDIVYQGVIIAGMFQGDFSIAALLVTLYLARGMLLDVLQIHSDFVLPEIAKRLRQEESKTEDLEAQLARMENKLQRALNNGTVVAENMG